MNGLIRWVISHWVALSTVFSVIGGLFAKYRSRGLHPVQAVAGVLAANVELRLCQFLLTVRDKKIAALEAENQALRKSQSLSTGSSGGSFDNPEEIPTIMNKN